MSAEPEQIKLVAVLQRWKPWLIGGAVLIIAALLVHTLRGLLPAFSYGDLLDAIRATSGSALGLALLATLMSFLSLTGYDASSLRYVGAQVSYGVAAETSFIAYALSNTVGVGVLTGGAVRLRLYGAAGVEAGVISRAIAFNAVAFMLGISVVGAAALLWGATSVAPALHLPAQAAASRRVACSGGRGRSHRPVPRRPRTAVVRPLHAAPALGLAGAAAVVDLRHRHRGDRRGVVVPAAGGRYRLSQLSSASSPSPSCSAC